MTTPTQDAPYNYAPVKGPLPPLLHHCMKIAQLRTSLLREAFSSQGFILNDRKEIISVDEERFKPRIKEITALFNNLQHSGYMLAQASKLSRDCAENLLHDKDVSEAQARWPQLSLKERYTNIVYMSHLMTHELNAFDPAIQMHKPIISLPTLPLSASLPIGMEVRNLKHKKDPHSCDAFLISVDRDTLQTTSFADTAAMLWHEHIHIFMSSLRDSYQKRKIHKDHELYEDAVRSYCTDSFGITMNSRISQDIYYAEPEERLCYVAQGVIGRTLKSSSPTPP